MSITTTSGTDITGWGTYKEAPDGWGRLTNTAASGTLSVGDGRLTGGFTVNTRDCVVDIYKGKPMRYLYKAYVIYAATEAESEVIIDVPVFIAKDE